MAIFGDLGKALGLGSGEDLLPLIGTAAGFYFGGPLGASIGSGIGSLAGGKSVNDALTNAALAYGVTSFLPANMSQSGNQSFLNEQIYGKTTGSVAGELASKGIQQAPTMTATEAAKLAPEVSEYGTEMIDLADSGSTSMFDSALDFMGDNKFLTASVGSGILGAIAGGPEEEVSSTRPYAGGEAHKVAYQGVEYDLRDPDQIQAYKEAKRETQKPGFKYDVESVYAKHGGAMYEHGIEHPAERGDYTGEVAGVGTGTSDSVPAWLSDGEFVLTAKAVKGAGGGDRDIGAARMYDMMAELEATA
jgi:hypothetical protein